MRGPKGLGFFCMLALAGSVMTTPMTARAVVEQERVIDITTPPDANGCLRVNVAANRVVNRCQRKVFAHYCTLNSRDPHASCTFAGAAMSWAEYGPDDPPAEVPGKLPSEDVVYWYECYGYRTQFNSAMRGPNVVRFDRQTGWHNTTCTDSAGRPAPIVYRSTRRAGGIPAPGL